VPGSLKKTARADVYLDTAYIVKYYLNEPKSAAVRALINEASIVYSSLWAVAEVHCVFHRHVREGAITEKAAVELARLFLEHAAVGLWNFIPVSEPLLRRAGASVISAPPGVFLRTADAVHLATARDLGEKEVWTNDRHMLTAAPQFGLTGRSV
jgi:predicted nucleic acid-binding protein